MHRTFNSGRLLPLSLISCFVFSYYNAVLRFSMRGCDRGPKRMAEKNKMLHPWHYKRSKSSKRSPLPYSHSLQYWHLVFLWSFALIKKRQKNNCQGCNSRVFVSCERVAVYVVQCLYVCLHFLQYRLLRTLTRIFSAFLIMLCQSLCQKVKGFLPKISSVNEQQ